MKLYANDGTQISWLAFWAFVVMCVVAWMVLGGIPIGLVAMIGGATPALWAFWIWSAFVGALTVHSVVVAFKRAFVNNKRFGGKSD